MGEKQAMARWSRCWAHPEFYSLGTKASAASNQNHFLSRRWRHPRGQPRRSRLPRAGLAPSLRPGVSVRASLGRRRVLVATSTSRPVTQPPLALSPGDAKTPSSAHQRQGPRVAHSHMIGVRDFSNLWSHEYTEIPCVSRCTKATHGVRESWFFQADTHTQPGHSHSPALRAPTGLN